MSTKDEYVRKMHSKLDHWNAEIDKLATKASQSKAAIHAEYNKQIEELRSKRNEARNKLERLQDAGEGAWEDMKAGVDMAWDAIGEAIDSAKSRFS
ncbi:MAG: coiled coil domain-containing protein [Gallionella sp.]|nr:coiled coil domain-containing protein [Gallionella sp.]